MDTSEVWNPPILFKQKICRSCHTSAATRATRCRGFIRGFPNFVSFANFIVSNNARTILLIS